MCEHLPYTGTTYPEQIRLIREEIDPQKAYVGLPFNIHITLLGDYPCLHCYDACILCGACVVAAKGNAITEGNQTHIDINICVDAAPASATALRAIIFVERERTYPSAIKGADDVYSS